MNEPAPSTASRTASSPQSQRVTVVPWVLALMMVVAFAQLTLLRPVDVAQALGVNAQDVGRHWWTVVTYPLVHTGFWPLALNGYTLWLFGPRVEARWGAREFARYGIVATIGGWMAHLLFVPAPTLLLGASALVLGVLLAYATLWPEEVLLIFGVWPVSMRWFILSVALLNLTSGALLDAAGGSYLAHAGGLVAGWLYLRAVGAVDLDRMRQSVSAVPEIAEDEMPRAVPKTSPTSRARAAEEIDDVVARANAAPRGARPAGQVPPPAVPTLDGILDKISASGIASLSPTERAILDAASRRMREP